jgi:hypothetical protein
MWCHWFSESRAKTPAQRHIRPTLEVLEDRTAPSVDIVYSGGPTIQHAQVNNIVMGAQPMNTTVLMQDLVRDYLPLLGPYYGVGAGTLRSSMSVAPFIGMPSNAGIQNYLVQEMNKGAIPAPGGNQVYFIFLPPGQTVSDVAGTETTGYHSNFYVYHDASGYHAASVVPYGTQLIPVYYAVSLGTSPSLSVTASHELAESVTDPNGTGFRDPTNPYGGEVADIYEFLAPFALDGFPVSQLSGPQGQIIGPGGGGGGSGGGGGGGGGVGRVGGGGSPQDFFALVVDEVEALAYQYLSAINPQLAVEAQAAEAAIYSNPFYGTPQGQMGIMLGEMVFYRAL